MKNNSKNLFIVIPVHNRKHLTRDCLLSLRKQTFQNFTTIVIDDGSSDGTSEMIQKEFPEVVLLRGNGNLWWTGAINIGVEYALEHALDDDYILTMNDDTIIRSNYLETLLKCASKHPRSLIGSISVSDSDESRVVDAGVHINWLTAKFTNIAKGKKCEDLSKLGSMIHNVDVIPGRGTLIPAEVFRDIGLYDAASFPHYAADYEFSRRAKMNGYSLLINYKSIVISRITATGLNNRVNRLTWPDLFKSFFSVRSANNLKCRWNFARLFCPGSRLLIFYICDMGRVIIGSLLYQTGFRKR